MPGWDSLETVTHLHGIFDLVGLVMLVLLVAGGIAAFFYLRTGDFPDQFEFAGYRLRGDIFAVAVAGTLAILVGTELLAYGYGHRQDTLVVAAADRGRAGQHKALDAASKGRRAAELASLKQQLTEAEQRADEARKRANETEAKLAALQAAEAHKRLSKSEKKTLVGALKPFAGQKVKIASILEDDDGKLLAEDLAAVFEAAGWDHNGEAGISYQRWERDPVGVEVTLNEDDARAGKISAGVGALINVVRELGLTKDNTIYMNGQVPAGEVQLKVGRKLRK